MKTSNKILLTLLALIITSILIINVALKIRVDKLTETGRESSISAQTDTITTRK